MQGQRPGPWTNNVYSVILMQGSPWGPLAVRRLDDWGLDSAPPLPGLATAAATCRSGSEAKGPKRSGNTCLIACWVGPEEPGR